MTDVIEQIGNSLVQHGKENNRVYLIKLKDEVKSIISSINDLVTAKGYTKIIAKVPENLMHTFINNGYTSEAVIKNYFKGEENCYFLCKYFDKSREEFSDKNDVFAIVQFCIEKANLAKTAQLDERFHIKQLGKDDIFCMMEIYKKVFESYPFPIFDGNYLLKTMHENIDYFGIFEGDKLVAVSSSEMDIENKNTEMTDFATLPEYRGNNFSYHLLKAMEKAAKEKGIKTVYTISRAKNTGINMAFAKSFYEFGGTLVNNTNICGSIETMNVWFKQL